MNDFERRCVKQGLFVYQFPSNLSPMPEGYAVVCPHPGDLWHWTNYAEDGAQCWNPYRCRRAAIEHAEKSMILVY